MNDIEILKNLVAEYDAQREENKTSNIVLVIDNKDINAIENLINRVKELEKENKRWEELAEESEYDYAVNLIPKSKIKAKIEELTKIKKDNLFITHQIYAEPEYCLQYGIELLQELLEEK